MLETELMGNMLKSSGGKKMRKRKELDALVARVRHGSSTGGCKGPDRGGVSHQDHCLSEFTGEEEYLNSAHPGRKVCGGFHKKNNIALNSLLKLCNILLITTCIIASITVTWLLNDIKEQQTSLRRQLDEVSAGYDVIPEPIQKSHLLLKKNETKNENHLNRFNQRLSNFYNKISGMQTALSKVEGKLHTFPLQKLIPHAQPKFSTDVEGLKTEIMEMQFTLSNMVNQQSEIKKSIKTMAGNISSFNNNLLNLKKLASISPSSDQRSKDNLVELIKGAIHPDIQSFNTSMFSRMKWLSYDITNAKKTTSNLVEGLEHLKSEMKTILYDLKLHNLDLNKLRSVIKKWNSSFEAIRTLKSKFGELVKNSDIINMPNKDSATGPPEIPFKFKSSTTIIPHIEQILVSDNFHS